MEKYRGNSAGGDRLFAVSLFVVCLGKSIRIEKKRGWGKDDALPSTYTPRLKREKKKKKGGRDGESLEWMFCNVFRRKFPYWGKKKEGRGNYEETAGRNLERQDISEGKEKKKKGRQIKSWKAEASGKPV